MALWIISFAALTGFILYFCRKYRKIKNDLHHRIKEKHIILEERRAQLEKKNNALKAKDKKFRQQNKKLAALKTEKVKIEAKYLKKLKAAEVKKKNPAKYRKKKRDTRTLKQQVEDIIGKGPKWLPHSCSEPRSHRIGKPKGSKGGGVNGLKRSTIQSNLCRIIALIAILLSKMRRYTMHMILSSPSYAVKRMKWIVLISS
ncbi:MAG: hypothetical protein ACTSWY_07530 [Promethearchaeota archaeon]